MYELHGRAGVIAEPPSWRMDGQGKARSCQVSLILLKVILWLKAVTAGDGWTEAAGLLKKRWRM